MSSSSDSDDDKLNIYGKTVRQKMHKHPRPHPFKIDPIKFKKPKNWQLPVKGKEIIEERYPGSLMLCAKTFSGKTTVENHIINHTTDERTKIIIFCSTINTDPSWLHIKKDLRRRGYQIQEYDSIFDDTGKSILPKVMEKVREEAKQRRGKKRGGDNEGMPLSRFFVSSRRRIESQDDIKEKPAPKDWVPDTLVMFDDLPIRELRHKSIEGFLKQNRHDEARVMISLHSLVHIGPSAMNQFSGILVWDGFSKDYIDLLHDRIRTSLTKEEFWNLYCAVCAEPHDFLYIGLREKDSFRHNFDLPKLDVKYAFQKEV